jgi:hypothetical protein
MTRSILPCPTYMPHACMREGNWSVVTGRNCPCFAPSVSYFANIRAQMIKGTTGPRRRNWEAAVIKNRVGTLDQSSVSSLKFANATSFSYGHSS